MARITQLTAGLPAPTHFRPTADGWERCCLRFPGRRLTFGPTPHQRRQLCEQLDRAHAAGVVHGDIHPRNVLLSSDGSRVAVVDWEPALRQIRRGRSVWVTTPGWQDPDDCGARTLSVATDLLGVWRIATRAGPEFFLGPQWRSLKQHCQSSAQPFRQLDQHLGDMQT